MQHKHPWSTYECGSEDDIKASMRAECEHYGAAMKAAGMKVGEATKKLWIGGGEDIPPEQRYV